MDIHNVLSEIKKTYFHFIIFCCFACSCSFHVYRSLCFVIGRAPDDNNHIIHIILLHELNQLLFSNWLAADHVPQLPWAWIRARVPLRIWAFKSTKRMAIVATAAAIISQISSKNDVILADWMAKARMTIEWVKHPPPLLHLLTKYNSVFPHDISIFRTNETTISMAAIIRIRTEVTGYATTTKMFEIITISDPVDVDQLNKYGNYKKKLLISNIHSLLIWIFSSQQQAFRQNLNQNNKGRPKTTIKFESDYDFEQANSKFEELRLSVAKLKVTEEAAKPEQVTETVSSFEIGATETRLIYVFYTRVIGQWWGRQERRFGKWDRRWRAGTRRRGCFSWLW